MPEEKQKIERLWICSVCKKERKITSKTRVLPRGWKRLNDDLFCRNCWKERYILRAVALPVVRPLEIEWKEFSPLLHRMWGATTQCSNWMMTQLYVRDVRRLDQEKLPSMEALSLYSEAGHRFPMLPPTTITALEHSVKFKYLAKRLEIIWTCASSLPTYRYPTPFPVNQDSWSITNDDTPVVSVRFGRGEEGRRVHLRLQSGVKFKRQMASVARLVSGEAQPGELALYRHRKEVMCKMVAWFPRTGAPGEKTGTLTVHTSAESLLIAFNVKDERLWTYNGDQILRWTAEHRKHLDRWSEDSKAEHRPVPPFSARRRLAVEKHRRRMATATHTMASMIVNYAVRRRFETILYDDTDKSFCAEFPFFELAQKIAEKADAAKLEFVHIASAPAAEEEPGPLAQ